jgi:hypothetical protein
MIDKAQAVRTNGHITGVLLMDYKGAFPTVPKRRRVIGMMVKKMDRDLIQWMESKRSEPTVELIIQGNAMERHPVRPGDLYGSPV